MSDHHPTPAAREDLVVQQLPGETLIYDQRNHQAHCLNRPAAAVWRACDGGRSGTDLRTAAENHLGSSLAPEAVDLALRQLSSAGLLRAPLGPRDGALTRRELVRRLGAAALVPALISLTAPPAHAQTSNCKDRGTPCTAIPFPQGDCCPGLRCVPVGQSFVCATG